MIIATLGKKGHGKDTVSDYITNKYGYEKIAFADPIKKTLKKLFGFSNEQLYGDKKEAIDEYWGTTPRILMQYLGTDIFRNDITKILPNVKNNFWVLCCKKMILNKINQNQNKNIVISDARFQNEVDMVHELNGIVIKIIRPNMKFDDHESEKCIDDINNYDYVIHNDGTIDELYAKIDEILNKI